jgi:hypothetical protein
MRISTALPVLETHYGLVSPFEIGFIPAISGSLNTSPLQIRSSLSELTTRARRDQLHHIRRSAFVDESAGPSDRQFL